MVEDGQERAGDGMYIFSMEFLFHFNQEISADLFSHKIL